MVYRLFKKVCVCVFAHASTCLLNLLINTHLGGCMLMLSVWVPACVQSGEMVNSRPQGTRCHREKQLRGRETAASSGLYQRWSCSNGGDIFPNTIHLL